MELLLIIKGKNPSQHAVMSTVIVKPGSNSIGRSSKPFKIKSNQQALYIPVLLSRSSSRELRMLKMYALVEMIVLVKVQSRNEV